MRYEATVNEKSLEMFDRKTRRRLDAVAVIPGCKEDLAILARMIPQDLAGDFARLLAWRAAGFDGVPSGKFDA